MNKTRQNKLTSHVSADSQELTNSIAVDTTSQDTYSIRGDDQSLVKSKPCWVYTVTLNGTDNTYVGITQQENYKLRWNREKWEAARGTKGHFFNALRKYGPEAFDWKVLCLCDSRQDAARAEQTYIAAGWAVYNKTKGGDGWQVGQYKHTEESKAKISASLMGIFKGRVLSQEHRAKMSAARKGKKRNLTQEQRAAISSRMKGKRPPEFGAKISAAKTGKPRGPLSDAHRANIGKSKLGVKRGPMSEEQKSKIGLANSGRVHTAEARAKMSASGKGRKRSNEATQKILATKARKKEQKLLHESMGLLREVRLDG